MESCLAAEASRSAWDWEWIEQKQRVKTVWAEDERLDQTPMLLEWIHLPPVVKSPERWVFTGIVGSKE